MKLASAIYRPVYALSAALKGADAIVNSDVHAHKFLAAWDVLAKRGAPPIDPKVAECLAVATGAVQVVASVAWALNRAPKTARGLMVAIEVTSSVVKVVGDKIR